MRTSCSFGLICNGSMFIKISTSSERDIETLSKNAGPSKSGRGGKVSRIVDGRIPSSLMKTVNSCVALVVWR